jgi:hypothetical protein
MAEVTKLGTTFLRLAVGAMPARPVWPASPADNDNTQRRQAREPIRMPSLTTQALPMGPMADLAALASIQTSLAAACARDLVSAPLATGPEPLMRFWQSCWLSSLAVGTSLLANSVLLGVSAIAPPRAWRGQAPR